jgi:hypothetical protein
LVQTYSTRPVFDGDRQDAVCEGGCAVSFPSIVCGVKPAATVSEVEEQFADACFAADRALGEPAACRHFLNWFDDADRADALSTLARWCRELLADWDAQTAFRPAA